ncbi:TIGR03943 family putative permease subunit [Jeotgalibacillus proteolyticus]|uniref:TIGR03943 family protein n=1 Tax=Jeotgalibacillus proteolyticus TaxID=2082395 RepID=A0A2S5G9G4_9BACL|nr:TIGR03943 family protein [Jeotgalibacillus proteolyticus]PPA69563.1 TIGR03943 family protein [Jeotgalibacillus proteolyticus]
MKFQLTQFLKLILLGAFSSFFFKLHLTGEIAKFINPKYILMSQLAGFLFILLFIIQLGRVWEINAQHHCSAGCNGDHDHSHSRFKKVFGYSVIILPLLTGYGIEPATLNSSIAGNKGLLLPQNEGMSQARQDAFNEVVSDREPLDENEPIPNNNYLSDSEYDRKMELLKEEQIEMSEDVFAVYIEEIQTNPQMYNGKKIKIKGFVYKENGLNSNQFIISRFLINHCVADARVVGMVSEYKDAALYTQDTWVELQGTIRTEEYNGVEIPVIQVEEVETISEPDDPYIFPILVKIV